MTKKTEGIWDRRERETMVEAVETVRHSHPEAAWVIQKLIDGLDRVHHNLNHHLHRPHGHQHTVHGQPRAPR